ncbi:MAG: DUF2961 domain-containing protein [Verrucomicrobiales bacterium]|jgi:hypothetical protein|nr:DUF2961 domain-containing protein [Verrucomicrobiales bacterium]
MNPLENYALVSDAVTRRASSYDRAGGNDDCLFYIEPGQTAVLLDTAGPGKITHLWATLREFDQSGHDTVARDLVLRMYWDGATTPSVEVPIGDFFGLGHALSPETFYYPRKYAVNSLPVALGGNERAFNCYWPMPFHQAARVEVYNNGLRTVRLFFYHIDYELGPQPANAALFHAAFGHEPAARGQVPGNERDYHNLDGRDNLVLLDTTGSGHYAGCFYYIQARADSWWGEGDDMLFIDGDPLPTITGTGSEDYFNNAWGYNHEFCHPCYGAPLVEKRPDGTSYMSLYRFHLADPVRFKKSLKVTIEKWWHAHKTNAVSFVVFWYQLTPAATRPPLPRGADNHPRRAAALPWRALDEGVEFPLAALEAPLRATGREVHLVELREDPYRRTCYGLLIRADRERVPLTLTVPDDGAWQVEVQPAYDRLTGPLTLSVEQGATVSVPPTGSGFQVAGTASASQRQLTLWVQADGIIPLHRIRLKQV